MANDRMSPFAAPDFCDAACVDQPAARRARAAMRPWSAVAALADAFRVLGDPTRIRITFALAREELCVCDLAAVLGVSPSVSSHSLRALRHMGVVRYRKVGKIAYYALDDEHIARLIDEGFRHVEARQPRTKTRAAVNR
jgi:ArsR family transcriptional regulator